MTIRSRGRLGRRAIGRVAAAAAMVAVGVTPLAGSDLQERLQARWQRAWVVLTAASHSNCDSLYTNNEVVAGGEGDVVSRGTYALPAGELARVAKIDLKRRRVDLLLDLSEPLLVEYQDGPFQLARQATCRVELLFPLEREVVKAQRIESIEAALESVAMRFADQESALAAESWNGRVVEPLPEGYEQTWREYELWKYSTAIEEAGEEIDRISSRSRYRDEPEYALGYAAGLELYQTLPDDCLALAEASAPYHSGSPPGHYDKDQKEDWRAGYADGARVGFYTRAITALAGCLADVR